MEIVFATGNKHKLEEVRQMLPKNINLRSLADFPEVGDISEPFDTLEENALVKADYLVERYGIPCFSDDSGLEVSALNMRPGVYSARYAGPEKDDVANRRLVLREMEGISDRRARFRAVIAYRDKDHKAFFEGIINGRLDTKETGTGGFGYDPIFIPEGYEESFGTLPPEIKQQISHRSRAMAAFMDQLKEWHIILPDQE